MSAKPDIEMSGQHVAEVPPLPASETNSVQCEATQRHDASHQNPQCQLLLCLANDKSLDCPRDEDGSGHMSDLSDEDMEVLRFLQQSETSACNVQPKRQADDLIPKKNDAVPIRCRVPQTDAGQISDRCRVPQTDAGQISDPLQWVGDPLQSPDPIHVDKAGAHLPKRQRERTPTDHLPKDHNRVHQGLGFPKNYRKMERPGRARDRSRGHGRDPGESPDRKPRERSWGPSRGSKQEAYARRDRALSATRRDATHILRSAFPGREAKDTRSTRERDGERIRERNGERTRERDRDRDRGRDRDRSRDRERRDRERNKEREGERNSRHDAHERAHERRHRQDEAHIKRKVELRPRDVDVLAFSGVHNRDGVREYWSSDKLDNRVDSQKVKHNRHRDAWDLRFENIPPDMDWAELRELGREYSESVFYATVLQDRGMAVGILKFRHMDEAHRVLQELDGRKIEGCSVPLKIILSESKKAS